MLTSNSVLDHSRDQLQEHTPDEYTDYEEYSQVLKKLLCLRKTSKKQLSEVLTYHKECMEMCRQMSERLEMANSEVLKCAADTNKLINIGQEPIPATIKNQLQRRLGHVVQGEDNMETKTSCKKKKLQDCSERLEGCCISPNCLKRPCNSEECACREVGEVYAMVNCGL
ncbi:uncharacterized protein LOC112493960 [Cephus cinctus]|uniref:Uncharacterized protein LOC112493960 n=1 Tax=Cephus cinctus TaxID=211228 RepID=A0AAJ7RC23_CEPCN|nr:uncharacterized protein LOC112493960 [Cephus cinctus]